MVQFAVPVGVVPFAGPVTFALNVIVEPIVAEAETGETATVGEA
jgi:hypothetical protein